MADGEESPASADVPRQRKARPEMQIYRPGMMRKGTDVTVGSEPPTASRPPEEPKKRPPRAPVEQNRTGRLSDTNRRKSNDTESVHSYRNDSGSTTPDAASICSERRDSGGRGGRTRTFTRGGGPSSNRRDQFDDSRSDYSASSYRSNGQSNRGYDSQNVSQYSSRQGSRDDVNDDRNRSSTGQPYNSTQSLYNTRQPGGYLTFKPRPEQRKFEPRRDYVSDNGPPRAGGSRFQRSGPTDGERASMRAEVGQRRVVGRRRNDSINSTQSERPPTNVELSVDTGLETQSQAGDALSSSSMSYMQLCQSFESMGSFDWSKEMEEECNKELQSEEEKKSQELQKRLEACTNGLEVQKAVNEQTGPVRGIIRINIGETPSAPPTTSSLRGASNTKRGQTQSSRGARGRGGRAQRVRRDSDQSSSFGGSIAEEVESEDELASGERTPTKNQEDDDRRWSSRGGRQSNRPRGQSPRRQPNGGSRSARYQENNDPNEPDGSHSARDYPQTSKYRGGHDYSREEAPPSRLQGRLSMQPQQNGSSGDVRVNGRAEARKPYQPPAIRTGHDRKAGPDSARVNRDSPDDIYQSVMSTSRSLSDYAVHKDIEAGEAPKIKQITDDMRKLLSWVTGKRDTKAARRLVELSGQMSEIYFDMFTRDIAYTFEANLEQHLWLQGYYKIFEALRTAANSVKSDAKSFREAVLQLLANGIAFYTRVLAKYEKEFGWELPSVVVWKKGLPADGFQSPVQLPLPTSQLDKKQMKSLMSCSRQLINMGSLHRYKTLIEGSEKYTTARVWYGAAAQLWPSAGLSYNQLSHVAFYSMLYRSSRRARQTPVEILSNQRQERTLEEIYFLIRALAVKFPYHSARDRLSMRFAAMKSKIDQYEKLLDTETGPIGGSVTVAATTSNRANEIWVAVDGVEKTTAPDNDRLDTYLSMEPSKLHRRTISYVLHMVGLLVTKIGMEQFTSVSERAMAQLSALLRIEKSPIVAEQVVQIVMSFIYAVHYAFLSQELNGTSSTAQQELTLNALVTLLGILSGVLRSHVEGDLSGYLNGTAEMPSQVIRILPALHILSTWFSSSAAAKLYSQSPSSLTALPLTTVKIDSWNDLAAVANILKRAESAGQLAKPGLENVGSPCIPAELFYVASFYDVFPVTPSTSHYDIPVSEDSQVHLATHARLCSILRLGVSLSGTDLPLSLEDDIFRIRELSTTEKVAEQMTRLNVGEAEDEDTSSLTRDEILDRERRKHEKLIVVRPAILVPDTNVLISNLKLIKKIADSGRHQLMISTIVLQELTSLSLHRGAVHENHQEDVVELAREGLVWVREQAKAKNPRLNVLTSSGEKLLNMTFVNEAIPDDMGDQVNDDRIVASIAAFVEKQPAVPIEGLALPRTDATVLYRQIVLLSDDRGIHIKAHTRAVPATDPRSFAKWARL